MRPIHPDTCTQLQSASVRVGLLCEIMYPTPLRLWTGRGDLTWDSKTFNGVGVFGGISAVREKGGAIANTVVLTLSGIPGEIVVLALANSSTGARATVWLATFDSNWNIVGDPIRMVQGKTDIHRITTGGKTGDVSVTIITPLSTLKQLRSVLWTHQEQQRRHPGDLFFDQAANMAERPLFWGIMGQGALAPRYGGGEAPSDGGSSYMG